MITAASVRDMLGLADRGAVRALFGQVLAGEVPEMLAALGRQYDLGQDPAQLLRELLELVHGITRQRMAPRRDPALSVEEQSALDDWAQALTFPRLSMLWQLLLKGLEEVQTAPVPLQAAEMALLRLCHAAELPDPGALIRQLQESAAAGPQVAPAPSVAPSLAPSLAVSTAAPDRLQASSLPAPTQARPPEIGNVPDSFQALVALFRAAGESRLAHYLTDDIRVVAWGSQPVLNARGVPRDVIHDIEHRIAEWTGKGLRMEWVTDGGAATLREIEQAAEAEVKARMLADPTVSALLGAFPDAELVPVKSVA
jgi:DNA polymerase-3 subunit gamma/tau